jgi:hypothetical protein
LHRRSLGDPQGVGLEVRADHSEELRTNAVAKIGAGELVRRCTGYENTVMPQLENALLAGHDIISMRARPGEGATRMIRSLTAGRGDFSGCRRQRDQRRSV